MKFFLSICVFLVCSLAFSKEGVITILIDPGHGGKDPGHLPSSDTLGLKQEKVLALEISQKIGNYLEHNLQNVEVLYTRTGDTYPSLDDRVHQANCKSVDYMLSIHVNGSPNTGVHGTETHIHDYKAKQSHKWAKNIESQFKQRAGRKSRGVKTVKDLGHSLQILKYTQMPTVLVECGFITHANEGSYLNSAYGQEIIASAIFRATREFLKDAHPEVSFELPEDQLPSEDNLASTEDSDIGNESHTAGDSAGDDVAEIGKLEEEYFAVQIMASVDEVALDIPEFKKLGLPVERKKIESGSIFKFKYYVGRYSDKKSAKQLQKKVQNLGFKDAFLVFFD